MQVGRRTDASPLVPFLILLELSIMVRGVEYPMETPHSKHTDSEKQVTITLIKEKYAFFKEMPVTDFMKPSKFQIAP